MICERCHGTGLLEIYPCPCPDCEGSGIVYCCEGEQAQPELETPRDRLLAALILIPPLSFWPFLFWVC